MFFSPRRSAVLSLLGLSLSVLPSCAPKPARLSANLVFLPFEYLGSSPTLEWTGLAVPGIASVQSSSLALPGIREAHINRIDHVVNGYITGVPGDLRVTAAVRDEKSQRTLRTLEARGTTVLEAASTLARQLNDKPKAYTSNNPEAITEFFSGHVDAAVALDPSFGAAQVSRVEALLRTGRKEDLPAAIASARASNLTDLERTRLEALVADTPKRRAEALLGLARAARYDLELWRAAADAALTGKNHGAAIEAFQKAIEFDPANVTLWNTLAYAQVFNGDPEGAKKSLLEYRRLQPADANALDSLGEIYYYDGRFTDAEKAFLQAFDVNNAFIGGGDLYRAALSRLLAGDRAKADEYFHRYIEFRQKHNDALAPLREAIWLYVTGRREEARQKAASIGSPAAKTQVVLWDLSEGKNNPEILGNRPELEGWKYLFGRRYPQAVEYWSKVYDASSLVNGNEARVLLAWALSGANRGNEAASLLAKWPLPPGGPEPGLSSIVTAKAIELKAGHR